MTRGEYPRSERDTAPWAGAGTVPAGIDAWHWRCGLPFDGRDWHRLVGRQQAHCLACGERFTDAVRASAHMARHQFDRTGSVRRADPDALAGRGGGDPLLPKQQPSGHSRPGAVRLLGSDFARGQE
jgi:hypothetical protein